MRLINHTADHQSEVCVLGGGPAGLTAALRLSRLGRPVTVLEAEPIVGGLARTEVRNGFRFDLGGHRFFTKNREIEQLWHEILGDELLERPRLSRIYYRGQFLSYPLEIGNLVRRLGPVELTRVLGSYVASAMRGPEEEDTFEQWVSNRFGRRLFELFFASYTEKVWGVGCDELRAEWASQRIRGLSLTTAVRSMLGLPTNGDVRSLIERFHYPKLGPGQMWEAMQERVESAGGVVNTSSPVEALHIKDGRIVEVSGARHTLSPDQVISSLPLPAVVRMASPRAPAEVLEAASGLRHRDFLTVALVLEGPDPFPDTWIYVHDPSVRVARIQNFRAWSPFMVPDPHRSCLGLEYFCFAGDTMWSMPDADLVELASTELERIGLLPRGEVVAGHVVRVPNAYPIYDGDYTSRVNCIRQWLDGVGNLQQIGRNGLHRYNNSDHSMLTGLRAAENLYGADHDLWAINADSWYQEVQVAEEQPYRHLPADLPELAGARSAA